MIEYLKAQPVLKIVADTATAGASTVGILTIFGLTFGTWASILTCIWFLILISKWIKADVVPVIKNIFKRK